MIEADSECIGCGVCASVCPMNAITMIYTKGFIYPHIDKQLCIKCNKCDTYCCKEEKSPLEDTKLYYGNSINKDIIKKSSSGGAFFELCKYCIEELKGIVCVPVFENGKVIRKFISHVDELSRCALGSKYIQCEFFQDYIQIRNLLEQGKIIYFSGTPCQIFALKKYLKNDYVNLITQDIICHGIGSRIVFDKYVKSLSRGRDIKYVSFRDKTKGWKSYCMKMIFSDGRTYLREHTNDYYMNLYLWNIILRPSCYICNFKSYNRCSDLTLGDFWGVDKIIGIMNDEGLSLIIANTLTGNNIIIRADLSLNELSTKEPLKYNSAYSMTVKKRRFYDKEIGLLINSNSFYVPYFKIRFHLLIERIINRLGGQYSD